MCRLRHTIAVAAGSPVYSAETCCNGLSRELSLHREILCHHVRAARVMVVSQPWVAATLSEHTCCRCCCCSASLLALAPSLLLSWHLQRRTCSADPTEEFPA